MKQATDSNGRLLSRIVTRCGDKILSETLPMAVFNFRKTKNNYEAENPGCICEMIPVMENESIDTHVTIESLSIHPC